MNKGPKKKVVYEVEKFWSIYLGCLKIFRGEIIISFLCEAWRTKLEKGDKDFSSSSSTQHQL